MNEKLNRRFAEHMNIRNTINLLENEKECARANRPIEFSFKRAQERLARAHRLEGKKSHSRREMKFA